MRTSITATVRPADVRPSRVACTFLTGQPALALLPMGLSPGGRTQWGGGVEREGPEEAKRQRRRITGGTTRRPVTCKTWQRVSYSKNGTERGGAVGRTCVFDQHDSIHAVGLVELTHPGQDHFFRVGFFLREHKVVESAAPLGQSGAGIEAQRVRGEDLRHQRPRRRTLKHRQTLQPVGMQGIKAQRGGRGGRLAAGVEALQVTSEVVVGQIERGGGRRGGAGKRRGGRRWGKKER